MRIGYLTLMVPATPENEGCYFTGTAMDTRGTSTPMIDPIAGRLRIKLCWTGERWQVDIRSSRPVTASQVFTEKPLTEVARQIPLLYSLCATAQAQAFASAAERILGLAPEVPTRAARAQLLQAELIKEHLWRLLLDWPPLLGLPREDTRMAQAMQRYQQFRAGLRASGDPFIPGARLQPSPEATPLTAKVASRAQNLSSHQHFGQPASLRELITVAARASLGMPATDWLTHCQTLDGWQRWLRDSQAPAARLGRAIIDQGIDQLGRAKTQFLIAPDLAAIEQQLSGKDAEAFIATPTIAGACLETTPLARMAERPPIADLIRDQGSGLLTRFAALLVELAQSLANLATPAAGAPPPTQTYGAAPRIGLAAVPAARGLLIHRLVTREDQIAQHQVVAPTEWNFHPKGGLAEALTCLPPMARSDDANMIDRFARLLVTAIDPCVDYALDLQTPR